MLTCGASLLPRLARPVSHRNSRYFWNCCSRTCCPVDDRLRCLAVPLSRRERLLSCSVSILNNLLLACALAARVRLPGRRERDASSMTASMLSPEGSGYGNAHLYECDLLSRFNCRGLTVADMLPKLNRSKAVAVSLWLWSECSGQQAECKRELDRKFGDDLKLKSGGESFQNSCLYTIWLCGKTQVRL